ncbi:facilitated trehalose transporter Tret1-2 homolog isoform X2 [Periplaneta americana]
MCGPLLDAIGRRKTLITVNIPPVIGWLILCLSPKPIPITMLFVGKVITGLASGISSVPPAIYIAEISTNDKRGMLLTLSIICMTIAVPLVGLLAWLLDGNWRLIAGIIIAPPVIVFILAFIFIKESPKWLLSKGRKEEADVSFRWLRKINKGEQMPPELRQEFEGMICNSKNLPNNNYNSTIFKATNSGDSDIEVGTCGKGSSNVERFKKLVTSLRSADVWKPLAIMISNFFFIHFSGLYVMPVYAITIAEESGIKINAYLVNAFFGCLQLTAAIIISISFSRYGRRPFYLISTIGTTISMIGLGTYEFVGLIGSDLWWIPLLFLIMNFIFAGGAIYTMLIMMGEVYPTRIAGLTGGITLACSNLFAFLIVKLYPTIDAAINSPGGVFLLFGAVSVMGGAFAFFFLPETHRKSREQIAAEFIKK